MSCKKIIVVIGATGCQGGAVARHFLEHLSATYIVRTITRKPSSRAALALQVAGAEIVLADLFSRSSLEIAFKNANVIFSVTNFCDSGSSTTEITQGRNIIDAARAVALESLENFIWSSLPDPRTLPFRYDNILHFNAKADISKYLRESPLGDVSTEVWVGSYFQNYIKFRETCGPQEEEDGSYIVTMPVDTDTKLYMVDVDDLGRLVGTIIKEPLKYHAETILFAAEPITPEEQLRIWTDHLGVNGSFVPADFSRYVKYLVKYHHFETAMARQMAENFAACKDNPDMWTRRYISDENEYEENVMKATEIMTNLRDWRTFVKETDWTPITG